MENSRNLDRVLCLALLMTVASCQQRVPEGPAVSDVIRNAKAVRIEHLTDREKEDLGKTFTYSAGGGWMSSDLRSKPIEDAYFVRAEINATALAYWTFLFDCGGFPKHRSCTEEELTQKTASALDLSEPYGLYGKYRNAWVFFQGNGKLPSTTKFDGHRIRTIRRSLEGGRVTDYVTIGPIPGMPSNMAIQLINNLTPEGKTLENPSIEVD